MAETSEERVWTDVKHLGGCPVCRHQDWCTYKQDEGNEDTIVVHCMREHDSENFQVMGERGKENAQGQPRTTYLVPKSSLTGGNGSTPSVSPTPRGKVFIFCDKRGKPTHKEIHKAAIFHWNGAGWSPGGGGKPKPLYRLPQVLEAIQSGEDVWITEGYKDADTLVALGACATSGGSAMTWLPEYTASLRGAKRVILCGDMDEPGRKHLERLKQTLALVVDEIWVISAFPGFEFGTGADVTDYIEAGHTLQDLLALMEPVEKPTLLTYSIDDLLTMDLQTDWIVENVLAPKGIAMILGQPAAGKSLLSLDLACSLAYKEKWLDQIPIRRNCSVLFLSGEGGAELLSERVRARPREERNATGKQVYFWTEDKDPDGGLSLSREKVTELVYTIQRLAVEVVIIDPLIEFHAGDENSQQEMAELVKLLREIIHATNVCVVVTHHTRKGDRHTAPGSMLEGRGSGVLVGAAETVLSLADKGEERHLFFSKIRRGRKPEDVALEFGDDLVFRYVRNLDDADHRPACLGGNRKVEPDKLLNWIRHEGKWLSATEIVQETGWATRATIKRHLDDLRDAGKLQSRERAGRARETEYNLPSLSSTTMTSTTTTATTP